MNIPPRILSWRKYYVGNFSLHIFPAIMINLLGFIYVVVSPVPKLFSLAITVGLFLTCGYMKGDGNISFKAIVGLITLITMTEMGYRPITVLVCGIIIAFLSNAILGFKQGDETGQLKK